MPDNTFKVKVNCIVFSTNLTLNERYVLSLNSENVEFPSFDLTPKHLENIEYEIIQFLKTFVFVNDLELLPQLININSKVLSKDAQELNIIYSSVVNHTININNAYWLSFNILKEQPYSQLIFEVLQKLR
jgi:hypothetical protein